MPCALTDVHRALFTVAVDLLDDLVQRFSQVLFLQRLVREKARVDLQTKHLPVSRRFRRRRRLARLYFQCTQILRQFANGDLVLHHIGLPGHDEARVETQLVAIVLVLLLVVDDHWTADELLLLDRSSRREKRKCLRQEEEERDGCTHSTISLFCKFGSGQMKLLIHWNRSVSLKTVTAV